MTCAYFVSDLHLSSGDEPNSKVFLAFLQRLLQETKSGQAEKPTHLFLVGDVFDLWIGGHEYFVQKFNSIVGAIRDLVNAGVSVHFFEGNHDLHLTNYWTEKVGVQVHPNAAYFELAGRQVRVEHGDLINPDDKGYLFLRKFLRTSAMEYLSLNLPSWVVKAIGERASRASRRYTSHHDSPKRVEPEVIRTMIRLHAEKAFIEKPFDLLISGHVHLVDDQVFKAIGREVRSVNLGSWFESARAFMISETRAEFVELS